MAELLRTRPDCRTRAEQEEWREKFEAVSRALRSNNMHYRAATADSAVRSLDWLRMGDRMVGTKGPFGHKATIKSTATGHKWSLTKPSGREMAHGSAPWLSLAKHAVATRMPGVVAGELPQSSRVAVTSVSAPRRGRL
jgi:hypothetical protein